MFNKERRRCDMLVYNMVLFGDPLEKVVEKLSSRFDSEEEIRYLYNLAVKRHKKYTVENNTDTMKYTVESLKKVGLTNDEIKKLYNDIVDSYENS